MNFGSRLKAVRKAKKLSQEALVANLNINVQTWSRYEQSKRYPEADIIEQFINFTGVNACWLFSGKGDMFGHDTSVVEVRVEDLHKVVITSNEDLRLLLRNLPVMAVQYGLLSQHALLIEKPECQRAIQKHFEQEDILETGTN